MRRLLLAGAVLALSACSSGGTNDANNASVGADNTLLDQNLMMDANALNGTDANGMAVNGASDANTENALEQDANTHDHDTNLANGT